MLIATSAEASVLWLSATKTSSAHARAGRQRRRFAASSLTGTITLTGTVRAAGQGDAALVLMGVFTVPGPLK